jgi:hypothetical protein
VAEIEAAIKNYQKAQRPSQKDSIPPFQKEQLARAKQIVEKHRTRLEDFKAELRSLHAKVKARKQAEEAAERARVAEIPEIAARLVEKVEAIDPDDLEIVFKLAKAKGLVAVVLNTREKLSELETEREFLNLTKGYEIPELPEAILPVCPHELKASYRQAFGEFYEPKRSPGSIRKASRVAQMRGELKDLAADG